jgi:hypothetical protein
LDEGVEGMGGCEGELGGVRKVEVVKGENGGGERVGG